MNENVANTGDGLYAHQLGAADASYNPFADANIMQTFGQNGSPVLFTTNEFRLAHNSFPWKDGPWEMVSDRLKGVTMTRDNRGVQETVQATERYVVIVKDNGRRPPIMLRDLSTAQLANLWLICRMAYPEIGKPMLDMVLIRNGRGSGHTIDHFHAHLASVMPGKQVRLFNGDYRAAFPNQGDADRATSCLANLRGTGLHWTDKVYHIDKKSTLRYIECKPTATGVKSHKVVHFAQSRAQTLLQLERPHFIDLFQYLGKVAASGNHFIYWERAPHPDLPKEMILPVHVIEVAPGACVKVLGTPF